LRDNLLSFIKRDFRLNLLPYGKKNRLPLTFTEELLLHHLKHEYDYF